MAAPIPKTPTEIAAESETSEMKLAIPQAEQNKTKPTGEEADGKAEELKKQGEKPTFSLEAHWKSCMAPISAGKHQRPLTQKERGELKMLADKVGPQTKDLMAFVVNNWAKFAFKAMHSAGLSTLPDNPHIGFLLAYHHVGMNLLHTIAPAPPSFVPTQPPPHTSTFDPKNVLGEEDYKPYQPSEEEFQKVLAELNS